MNAIPKLSDTARKRLQLIYARGSETGCPDRIDMSLERKGLIEFSKPHDNAIITKKMTLTAAGREAIGMPEAEPVRVCRHCKQKAGEKHLMTCVHNRGKSQKIRTDVMDYDTHVLTIKEGRDIAVQLVQIKNRLGQLGLFRTMHKLDLATTEIGYELAEHPEFQR